MQDFTKQWIILYRILGYIFLPIIIFYFIIRVYLKKEDLSRISERFGFSTKQKKLITKKQIIWINAVSIGEANTAFVLAEQIANFSKNSTILITTTTITSAKIIEQKISICCKDIIHQFMPIDLGFCINNFLNYWQPKAIILIESEIWPNLIYSSKSRSINVFLVNARISSKSKKRWQKIKKLGFNIFDYFALIFAQSDEEKNKLQTLTKNEILNYGNLKSEIINPIQDLSKINNLKSKIENRDVWLCASTHQGEEEIIINIHQKLKKYFPNLLTIIVLRHPNRINEVINLSNNLKYAVRSKNNDIKEDTDLYFVDTLNELTIFYELVNFALIGGSLFAIGGHNPYEAIRHKCAIISGDKVDNFKEIYQQLDENNSVKIIKNSNELYQAVFDFLSDKNLSQSYIDRASNFINNSSITSQKIIKKIDQILLLNF